MFFTKNIKSAQPTAYVGGIHTQQHSSSGHQHSHHQLHQHSTSQHLNLQTQTTPLAISPPVSAISPYNPYPAQHQQQQQQQVPNVYFYPSTGLFIDANAASRSVQHSGPLSDSSVTTAAAAAAAAAHYNPHYSTTFYAHTAANSQQASHESHQMEQLDELMKRNLSLRGVNSGSSIKATQHEQQPIVGSLPNESYWVDLFFHIS